MAGKLACIAASGTGLQQALLLLGLMLLVAIGFYVAAINAIPREIARLEGTRDA